MSGEYTFTKLPKNIIVCDQNDYINISIILTQFDFESYMGSYDWFTELERFYAKYRKNENKNSDDENEHESIIPHMLTLYFENNHKQEKGLFLHPTLFRSVIQKLPYDFSCDIMDILYTAKGLEMKIDELAKKLDIC
jgi:hypothetical protein